MSTKTISASVPEGDLPEREVPTTAELLDAYVNGAGVPAHVPSTDGRRAVPVFGGDVRTISIEEQLGNRPVPPRVCEPCSETVIRREYTGDETGSPLGYREVTETKPYRYFGVWDGECPKCLVPRVLSGEVRIADASAAEDVVRALSARTGHTNEDDWRVIGAAHKRARFEALRAAQKDLGIEPGDDVPASTLPTLVSIDQVARWWSVDESTVREWVRKNKLPRPYKIGGTVRFNAMAILHFIQGGHDLNLPEGPRAPRPGKGAAA